MKHHKVTNRVFWDVKRALRSGTTKLEAAETFNLSQSTVYYIAKAKSLSEYKQTLIDNFRKSQLHKEELELYKYFRQAEEALTSIKNKFLIK